MNTVELPIVSGRPACLEHHELGEEFPIVLCVDYYINLLVSHSPAELTADHSLDGKQILWSLGSFPEKKLIHTETMPTTFYRQCLARIAVGYMGGCVYGGFSRMHLARGGKSFRAAFYLGNDGLCGFWFRGRCSGPVEGAEMSETR